MQFNETPSGERLHIGFFGRRNAGKSSLFNSLLGQTLAIVSAQRGTTTDPVQKAMELLPFGPVVLIDTPGLDDEGEMGRLRIEKARQVLRKTDLAVVVIDASTEVVRQDIAIIQELQEKGFPFVVALNKWDLVKSEEKERLFSDLRALSVAQGQIHCVSTATKEGVQALKECLGKQGGRMKKENLLVGDLLSVGDVVVLVTPLDASAPKGRLILPQQQVIRGILEAGAMAYVTREIEFARTVATLKKKPKLIITDSQVFEQIQREAPKESLLTSFSILMARARGVLGLSVKGAKVLEQLQDGDRILIAEGCTHHRQCEDIGTVKFPRWLKEYTKRKLVFQWMSGTQFPEDPASYRLVIHCGGCMLNQREVRSRYRFCEEKGVPVTNYGIAIAKMKGCLERSLRPFA